MEWVSVKDRLPEKSCQCLCAGRWTGIGTIRMLRFDIKSKKFYDFNGRVVDVDDYELISLYPVVVYSYERIKKEIENETNCTNTK